MAGTYAIQSGTHLGPYEIVSAIAAGGTGEVCRATTPSFRRMANGWVFAGGKLKKISVKGFGSDLRMSQWEDYGGVPTKP